MMKTTYVKVFLTFFVLSGFMVQAQNISWKPVEVSGSQRTALQQKDIPAKALSFSFNYSNLQSQLHNAPERGVANASGNLIIQIPNANGDLERFEVIEASVMAPELQAKYPEIRSYAGFGIDDPSAYLRFSISPYKGMNGIVLSGNTGATIIEGHPGQANRIAVFNRKMRTGKPGDRIFSCETEDVPLILEELGLDADDMRSADDGILRTFELTVSTTGEYSTYHGGTLATVNAAITTTMTRVNGIFENEFNVTMTLIAGNDSVLYFNTATDPYGNTTGNYNTELRTTLESVIGESNYDVGHLFANLQNNGNAGCIGCVCSNANNNDKGSGWTSAVIPEGDFFDVDYVAHEMGHQFGANHTWTHGGNEGTNVQVEPGSGSTIMSYAGITGATDVQPNVDPYFHTVSVEQVTANVKTKGCDGEMNTGNSTPTANAGSNITLPIGTPFRLIGSGSDTDGGDILTYCWEQIDEDNASTTYPDETSTSNNSVLFRSYNPTTSTERIFPKIEDLLDFGVNGTTWERIPTVSRSADFRLTVRDNRPGGASNNYDDMIVTWDNTKGPLAVTSQNTSGLMWSAGDTETISWDVNSTDTMAGASNVDILLSIDGGLTYPITLVSNTVNDGTENIIVPNNPAPFCRVMVQPTGAQFFAINTVDFAIDYIVTESCTQYAQTPNLAIPDGTGANSPGALATATINIPDDVEITDVNVYLDVTHSWVNDLVINVNNVNDNDQVTLVNRVCNNEDGIDATFDDTGSSISCGGNGTLITGTVQPSGSLADFNGQMSGGDWDIELQDYYNADTGTLNSFYIEICSITVEPSGTLSTSDSELDNLFKIYPNPNNGSFNVEFTSGSDQDITVDVYDIRGRKVFGNTYGNQVNFNETIRLNVQTGIYMVQVSDGAFTDVKKVIIE